MNEAYLAALMPGDTTSRLQQDPQGNDLNAKYLYKYN